MTTIHGATKLVWLLGDPVEHSKSPQMHNRAFAALGLPYAYVPLRVAPKNLHSAIFTIRASDSVIGANVTIPHKEAALKYCDEVSGLSAAAGTVNTLYKKEGRLCGTTTDAAGFYAALASAGRPLAGGDDAVILGGGGTARTLGAAMLIDKKCNSLTIAARSAGKAAALASALQKINGANAAINFCELNSRESEKFFAKATLIVNCTSAGMFPNADDAPLEKAFLHGGMTVFDAVYNPEETKLLQLAAAAGCRTVGGLPMLINQARASFKYWTGAEMPEE